MYFVNLYGWVCDNVILYEVVIVIGLIVIVLVKFFFDFYWVLCGGGNNFGIVIVFNFEVYFLLGGNIWGGVKLYIVDLDGDVVVEVFVDVVVNLFIDLNVSLFVVWM